MKLIYNVNDKPNFSKLLVFALQQLLAIMTATLVVPIIVSSNEYGFGKLNMSSAAALFGAGVGTLVYVLFTRKKSPVFLGSSFAFLGSMAASFAGATTAYLGYLGLIMGAIVAGLVYVVIAIFVKIFGVKWIDKLMPAVVIGPTVAIIGLSLSTNAISDLVKGETANTNTYLCIICGLITLFTTIIASTFGKKMVKLIPFIIGIASGYIFALILTIIGKTCNIDSLVLISFESFENLLVNGKVSFKTFLSCPDFTFINAFKGFKDLKFNYFITIFVAYAPVAFVVFAEHIADHKNISSIIEKDLLADPGLDKTLLGDGIGSMVGAFFGGCPNTTYGESIGCVAITRNASVITIITASILAIIISFISPVIALIDSIPSCVMGGVCIALYGFIAVSGLKMIQDVNLGEERNLFVVSTILVIGIGGLTISFGSVKITEIACALIVGILVNLMLKKTDKKKSEEELDNKELDNKELDIENKEEVK